MQRASRFAPALLCLALVLPLGCREDDPQNGPMAAFEAVPATGTHPLLVTFQNLSQGDWASQCWDFGDGCESLEKHPKHTYLNPGVYTVTLTLYDAQARRAAVETRADAVTVNHAGPVARFDASPRALNPFEDVAFTDASLGEVTAWSWDFGDGGTSTEQHPVHAYALPGSYTVSLSVSGPNGSDDRAEARFITVYEPGPPVADFSASPLAATRGLPVQFTSQCQGTVTSLSWDFGDGATSLLSHPMHAYAANGTYTVSLTAAGPNGQDTETKTGYVTVSDPVPPSASFTSSPALVYTGVNVQFQDTSTGTVTGRSWSFGDGAMATASAPVHAYNLPGRYTVSLTVSGPAGSDTAVQAGCVTVVQAGGPQAQFSASPTSTSVGTAVSFTDQSTGLIDNWLWDFGDGASSAQANPSHAYAQAGNYTVRLTVSGPAGSDTETKTHLITVGVPPPVASFWANPLAGASPLTVHFTDTSTGSITSWAWSFGDGATSTLQNPSHTYVMSQNQFFTVSLTVTGPGGSHTCTKQNYIGYNPFPTPPPKPVIYLYRPVPVFETLSVHIDGTATVTIPEVPLGPVITWHDVWLEDGRLFYEGEEYPYLFYESETTVPIHAHRGWILRRDEQGRLFLDGEPVSFGGLASFFASELRKAGLYEREIDDFVEHWFGPDRLVFFGQETFTFAVKYFPVDQYEAIHRLETVHEYDSVVRIAYLVEFAEPGASLLKPVYPVPQPGNTVLHEWALVPYKELAGLYLQGR